MNILVTGANGQLGNAIQLASKESKDNYVFTDVCEGYEKLDITDLEAVRAAVKEKDIKCVINCAAWTNVDAAETPATSWRLSMPLLRRILPRQ